MRCAKGLRDTDLRGRLGGDEFVAYLTHTDPPAARQVAEAVLTLIRPTSAALGPGMQTTASIGIATDYTPASDPAEMLHSADSAMYRAKRDGGNRLALWETVPPHETKLSGGDPGSSRSQASQRADDAIKARSRRRIVA